MRDTDSGTRTKTRSAAAADAAAPAQLVVVQAPDPSLLGRRLPLGAAAVLGRDPGCDLVLPLDDVSRRHARVAPAGEGHELADLGSTNGTFVAGERVARRVLAPGDLVAVGSALLKYLGRGDPEAGYHERMALLARRDGLTGLANRAAFDEALAREWGRGGRRPAPLALLLLDVDHFKRVNDGLGHAAGDAVLRELAVILPDADLAAALALGERCRAAVEARAFRFEEQAVAVTVSAGAAARAPGDAAPAALVARADARLYEAKAAGRNRVRG